MRLKRSLDLSNSEHITLTFLGTGTSQGVPVIGCECTVCKSNDARNHRLRTSVMVHDDLTDTTVIIDTSMDFRQQMLRNTPHKIDAVLYTHEHRDHTGGLDDLRPFIYKQQQPAVLYCTDNVKKEIMANFSYAFREKYYPGAPQVIFNVIDDKPFVVNGLHVQPLPGIHYQIPVTGYRFGKIAYMTDFNQIPEPTFELLEGVEVLIINALEHEKHISHFSLGEALEVIARVKPKKAYLTHMSHRIGLIEKMRMQLPDGVFMAYDGLELYI